MQQVGFGATNNSGYYTASKIPNGNYFAVPSIYGYDFVPEKRSLTVAHDDVDMVDFSAIKLPRYKIDLPFDS